MPKGTLYIEGWGCFCLLLCVSMSGSLTSSSSLQEEHVHAAELKLQRAGENCAFGTSAARPFMTDEKVGLAPSAGEFPTVDLRWPKVHDPRREGAAFRDRSQRKKWVNRRAINTLIEFHQPPRKEIDSMTFNTKGGIKFALSGEFARSASIGGEDAETNRRKGNFWQ